MKKLLSLLLILALFCPHSSANSYARPINPMRDLTGAELTREMGTGWNLGNTMDGHNGFTPSETTWQPTVTTQKLVTAVHDAGFNTMRLPVTWGTMIDDENGYKINEAWLSRVQDIADYAIKQDMYVIINLHHDGAEQTGWLRIAHQGEDGRRVQEKFSAVWKQIALAFRDYDEHLIFEAMNEVAGNDNTTDGFIRDFRTIEALNQIFVDTVRATGSNNSERWLMVAGRYTNIANTLNPLYGFTLPIDSCEKQRLILSVHEYDYSFGILATMGATLWNQDKALNMMKAMQQLKTAYVDKGIPVVLGEYGAVNKNNDGNRAYYYEAVNRICVMCGIVPVTWDIGWYDRTQNPDYTFSLFDRTTGEELFPGITQAIMRGYYRPVSGNLRRNILNLTKPKSPADAPYVAGYEKIDIPQPMINLTSGDTFVPSVSLTPLDSSDTLTWATTNPEVVSVSNGVLHAKAPGSAQITVSSKNGTASDMVIAVVKPATVDTPISFIGVSQEVVMECGQSLSMNVALTPANHTDRVFFQSSNPRVASVNTLGKIVALANGETTVTISTASGLKQMVSVTVKGMEASVEEGLKIGIGVYYNDVVHNYYVTETGETLLINGDGTYTLTFDCKTMLSDKAKKAGVESLTGVGAIYLYDISGTANILSKCNIHFDKILLDGVPMTIVDHAPKSTLKANGKFDTNDPINAWDGSFVNEVAVDNYVITFTENPAPTSISVTFTLSDFTWNR